MATSTADARLALLPAAGVDAVYVHLPAGADGADRVAGPYDGTAALARLPGVDADALLRLGALRRGPVLRVGLHELSDDPGALEAALRPVAYEHVDPRTDPAAQQQREAVARRIVADPALVPPPDLEPRAAAALAPVIDGLFRHALCSMTRIVLSVRFADLPGWIGVTTRDQEKRTGERIDVVPLLARPDGTLSAPSGSRALPTSGALTARRFHDRAGPGVMLHAHLLAPVLADREFDGVTTIDAPPRSDDFGDAVADLLGGGARAVLRRSEGIWSAGATGDEALAGALASQAGALALLWAEPARAY